MAKRTTLYRYLTGPDDASFCHRVRARSVKVGTTFTSGKRTRALSLGWSLYGQPTLTFNTVQGRVGFGQAIIKDVDAAYAPTLKLSEQ